MACTFFLKCIPGSWTIQNDEPPYVWTLKTQSSLHNRSSPVSKSYQFSAAYIVCGIAGYFCRCKFLQFSSQKSILNFCRFNFCRFQMPINPKIHKNQTREKKKLTHNKIRFCKVIITVTLSMGVEQMANELQFSLLLITSHRMPLLD